MSTKLYVGNISYQTSEEELSDVFASYGEVASVKIIKDFETGRSKGFAFVEMNSEDDAQKCISNLDGSEVNGRSLKVNVAREKTSNSRRRF